MQLQALLAVLLLLVPYSLASDVRPRAPQPKNYDTHTYYALELGPASSESSALSVARSLGVELVEPIGQLENHWLVRSPGSTPNHSAAVSSRAVGTPTDRVVSRWHNLKARSKRDDKRHLRSITPLTLKQRSKRVPPGWSSSPVPGYDHHGRALAAGMSEFTYAQTQLHLMDPMLQTQWHLINEADRSNELNVTGLWGRGITGDGVKVVIVDDGLDMTSDDLAGNFVSNPSACLKGSELTEQYAEGSWDFNDNTELPLPRLSDDQHGTRCAGEIAAVANDVCGVGVSYTAKIAGVRILSEPISDADEAAALNFGYQLNDIYSCSWGPPDDGRSMEAPDGLILKAMVNGVQNGRGGKGSVFVFAAGNGGGADDQCNFDGYTNSIFSVTVGAVDKKGLHPYYSEMCAAMMIVAPSSGSGDHIHTTDVGKNKCAHTHGGTSAAAPLAAGVFALALQVRPDLTWRDVQHIAIHTGVHFNADDPDWDTTSAGRKYSYKYGYGRLDAGLFVEGAERWKLVKPQAWFDSPAVMMPNTASEDSILKRQDPAQPAGGAGAGLPDLDDGMDQPIEPPARPLQGSVIPPEGLTSTYEVKQDALDNNNFERLEHVTVRVWIEHDRRGDVEVELVSPNGVHSVLARQRRYDEDKDGFPGWKFMTLKHWDEDPVGTWSLFVKDQNQPDRTGRLIAWSLQLWGECVDPELAHPWAPAEEGEPDEEETGSASTPVVSQKPKPTAHLPGDHGEAEGEAHKPGLSDPSAGDEGDSDSDYEDVTNPSEGAADEGLFGGIEKLASSSTWLAGAGFIVVLAGAGAGLAFWLRARRRQSSSKNLFGLANNGSGARGAYEPVDEDISMSLLERGRRKISGGGGGRKGGTAEGRAGSKDLYDAFGDGPSDDEDSEDDARGGAGLDERAALRYHDDFLEDEVAEGKPPVYRDEDAPADAAPKRLRVKRDSNEVAGGSGSGSGSSGSWQDAEDEPRR